MKKLLYSIWWNLGKTKLCIPVFYFFSKMTLLWHQSFQLSVCFTNFSVATHELNFSLLMILLSQRHCLILIYSSWCIGYIQLPFILSFQTQYWKHRKALAPLHRKRTLILTRYNPFTAILILIFCKETPVNLAAAQLASLWQWPRMTIFWRMHWHSAEAWCAAECGTLQS